MPAHRLENIFRTNIQGHYTRGRCEQQKREEAMADQLKMPEAVAASGGKMPEPRRLDLPLLPTGQGERFYLERYRIAGDLVGILATFIQHGGFGKAGLVTRSR